MIRRTQRSTRKDTHLNKTTVVRYTAGRNDRAGDAVEQRRLARAVRPDDRVQVALRHRHVHAADGGECTEMLREIADFQKTGHRYLGALRRAVAKIGRASCRERVCQYV